VNVQEILRELVGIPTPSSVSNLPLLGWVERFLQTRGWRVHRFPYNDEKGVPKANLIARPVNFSGEEQTIALAFVCHTDTVLIAGDWKDPLHLSAEEDTKNPDAGKYLHGLGACDVKGSLACFLAALDGVPPEATDPDVALILTADEEIGCKGMEHLLADTNLRIGSAIVSEPTSLRPAIAGKGYGLARVTINGIEAHSAFPAEGVSAIALAAHFITRVEGLLQQFSDNLNAPLAANLLFDPPCTTVNVGMIDGGTAKNIVAGSCSFLVEWRPIPSDAPRAVLTELQWLADSLRMEEPRAHIHVEPLRAEPGFARSNTGPLELRLKEIAAQAGRTARPRTGISFGSEASRLARVSGEVIVIGPGDMHTAHSERECVPVAELEEWTETLRALLTARKETALAQESLEGQERS
jgi:acetylornithine deacetylase